jgi:hypothetical protein
VKVASENPRLLKYTFFKQAEVKACEVRNVNRSDLRTFVIEGFAYFCD